MTREDAKKTLQDMWECLFNEMTTHTFEDLKEHGMLDNYSTAFDMAISALSENKGDLISRQAVLEGIAEWIVNGYADSEADCSHISSLVTHLPSVENKGEWISQYDEDGKTGWYECSRCHSERAFNTNFCPDCGADMREPKADDLSTMFENVVLLSKSDKEKMKSWEIEPKGKKVRVSE